VASPELRATPKKNTNKKQRLCRLPARTAFVMQPARFDLNVLAIAATRFPWRPCWPSRPSDTIGQQNPETALLSAPSSSFIKGKCMLPGESQLAYIWPFDEDWEKPRRSPPPHTCFDISLTGCSYSNHRLGGKTRNVMCLPIIGVMELVCSPTIVNLTSLAMSLQAYL
jgi:hypothetical protein